MCLGLGIWQKEAHCRRWVWNACLFLVLGLPPKSCTNHWASRHRLAPLGHGIPLWLQSAGTVNLYPSFYFIFSFIHSCVCACSSTHMSTHTCAHVFVHVRVLRCLCVRGKPQETVLSYCVGAWARPQVSGFVVGIFIHWACSPALPTSLKWAHELSNCCSFS